MHLPAVEGLHHHRVAVHLRHVPRVPEGLDLVTDVNRAPGLEQYARGEVLGDPAQGESHHDAYDDCGGEERLDRDAEQGGAIPIPKKMTR